MPRDLADVLHYFMPELADKGVRPGAPVSVISVPIGDRDVVRAAFAWNLAVEVARIDGNVGVLTPGSASAERLFPFSPWREEGESNAVLRTCSATNLSQLEATALAFAADLSADNEEAGLVLVRVPPAWLEEAESAASLLRWMLIFSSSDPRDLVKAYEMTKRVARSHPDAEIGVTIHGAKDLDQARDAYEILAASSLANFGKDVARYGLVPEDLDVCRAIAARRPIGLAHPFSPAARALRDVARLMQGQLRDHLCN